MILNAKTYIAVPKTAEGTTIVDGCIVVNKKNPIYGSIRVESSFVEYNPIKKFANHRLRSSFVNGKIEELKMLGFKPNMPLGGKIIQQKSFLPFYEDQEPVMTPANEATGEPAKVALIDGNPYYHNYVWTDDPKDVDHWVDVPETNAIFSAPAEEVETEQMF